MKTAGDILSTLFDERLIKKAQGYSRLFDSWKDITEKNGIRAAADHSRIKDLDRGIMLIEMDHPGWKQILQTKQSKILNDFRIRFPELEISGISLMLGRSEPNSQDLAKEEPPTAGLSTVLDSPASHSVPLCLSVKSSEKNTGYDAIKDEELKEVLKRLGQRVAESEKKT